MWQIAGVDNRGGKVLVVGGEQESSAVRLVYPDRLDNVVLQQKRLASPAGVFDRVFIELMIYQHIVVSDLRGELESMTYIYESGFMFCEIFGNYMTLYKPRKGIKIVDLNELQRRFIARNNDPPPQSFDTLNSYGLQNVIPIIKDSNVVDLITLHEKSVTPTQVHLRTLQGKFIVHRSDIGEEVRDAVIRLMGKHLLVVSRTFNIRKESNKRTVNNTGYLLSIYTKDLSLVEHKWLGRDTIKDLDVALAVQTFKTRHYSIAAILTAGYRLSFLTNFNNRLQHIHTSGHISDVTNRCSTVHYCKPSSAGGWLIVGMGDRLKIVRLKLS